MTEHFEIEYFLPVVANIYFMKEKKDNIKRNWKEIDKKYKRVVIRFDEKQQLILETIFKKSDEKYLATFIKKCIFYGDTNYKEVENKYIENEKLYKIYIDNLRRIGTNINQISMKLNHINFINDGEKELLFESLEELKGEIFDFRKRKKLHE